MFVVAISGVHGADQIQAFYAAHEHKLPSLSSSVTDWQSKNKFFVMDQHGEIIFCSTSVSLKKIWFRTLTSER